MVTADSVREAGIAAHLAVDTAVLPEPSIYFQDFNFGGTMFDALFGNAEALGGVGAGISDVALEQRMALEAEDRKKDDPAGDAMMIAELAESQREAMRQVTYSNGQFHMFGMDIDEEDMDAAVDETLENIDAIAAKHGLDAQQKAELATLLIAYQNADTPEEKAEILGEIAEAQPEVAREMADNAAKPREQRAQSELSSVETQDAEISEIRNNTDFEEERASTLDDVALVEDNVAVRSDISIGDNPFADTRSPNAEFNTQASGNVQMAEATPLQTAPTVSVPTLANG